MPRPFLLVLLFSLLSTLTGCAQDLGWASVTRAIRAQYPGVEPISTDTLAARLRGRAAERPVLLDVRKEAEYRVSHLRGARRIDPDAEDFSVLEDLDETTPIVTYCSVGYRSAALAERLEEAGFTNVVNLEGSIFAWANEGRPVYRGDRRVRAVHPYDSVWGRLLNEELRAYE